MRTHLLVVLLVLQAGLALVALLGLVAFNSLSHTPQPNPPELIALGGGLVLLVLAARTTTSRLARVVTVTYETLTLLGGMFRLVIGGFDSPGLVATMTTLLLPTGVLVLVFSHRPAPADTSLTRQVAAGLMLISGVIHLSLVSEHLALAPSLGVLFALDGAAFVCLALAALADATWWRPPSIVLLTATLLAYLVVVLRGQEEVDDLAVATKLVELLALGVVLLPRSRARALRWLVSSAGLLLAVVVTGTLAWAAEMRPHSHAANAVGHSDHSHVGKHVQVSAPPTPEQRAAAEHLLEDTRRGIARFQDAAVALADGYRPSPPLAGPTVHYTNPAYAHGHLLDPQHPQSLVYANTPSGPRLLGAMYMMPDARTPGVAVGGSLTEWHVHNDLCFLLPGPALIGFESPFQTCPTGALNATTPAMLHVWTVDNPSGPFGELDPAGVGIFASQLRP